MCTGSKITWGETPLSHKQPRSAEFGDRDPIRRVGSGRARSVTRRCRPHSAREHTISGEWSGRPTFGRRRRPSLASSTSPPYRHTLLRAFMAHFGRTLKPISAPLGGQSHTCARGPTEQSPFFKWFVGQHIYGDSDSFPPTTNFSKVSKTKPSISTMSRIPPNFQNHRIVGATLSPPSLGPTAHADRMVEVAAMDRCGLFCFCSS